MSSRKPYFIRAIYEWCNDNGLTPYLASMVDQQTTVPSQYVQDGQIIFNVSDSATKDLEIKNDWISFKATFGGVINEVYLPIENIIAIFAKENGQGMQFEVPKRNEAASDRKIPIDDTAALKGLSHLKLIK